MKTKISYAASEAAREARMLNWEIYQVKGAGKRLQELVAKYAPSYASRTEDIIREVVLGINSRRKPLLPQSVERKARKIRSQERYDEQRQELLKEYNEQTQETVKSAIGQKTDLERYWDSCTTKRCANKRRGT